MVAHGLNLQRKQAFLFRLVDIGLELFAMAATVANATTMKKQKHPEAAKATELADLFCRNATRKVRRLFHDLWSNDDAAKYAASKKVMSGEQSWVEEGIVKKTRNEENENTK